MVGVSFHASLLSFSRLLQQLGVNKYFSTNLAFQVIYDDNAFQGLQTRQMIGLGINYSF